MVAVTTSGQAVPRLVAVGDSAGLDPACLLPLAIGVDDSDTPGDMLDALALAPLAAGTQPHASTVRLGPLPPGQASGLLGRPVAGPVTLAELYGMRSGHVLDRPADAGTALYL